MNLKLPSLKNLHAGASSLHQLFLIRVLLEHSQSETLLRKWPLKSDCCQLSHIFEHVMCDVLSIALDDRGHLGLQQTTEDRRRVVAVRVIVRWHIEVVLGDELLANDGAFAFAFAPARNEIVIIPTNVSSAKHTHTHQRSSAARSW